MSVTVFSQFRGSRRFGSFNMTPVIDIVFLLIIFFCVVCHFIEAENFPVAVPDGCEAAQNSDEAISQLTTVTVMNGEGGKAEFAVGAEKITVGSYGEIGERLAELIDNQLENLPKDSRVVTLRVDKDVCYGEAQYALAGITASTATDIRLAALKDEQVSAQ